jgi:hypothetical protein
MVTQVNVSITKLASTNSQHLFSRFVRLFFLPKIH